MSRTKLAIATLVITLASTQASAFFIDNAGDSLNFSWSYAGGGYNLTGAGTMTATDLEFGSLTLEISLTNNTVAPTAKNARLTAFGFGIDPNATGVTFSDNNNDGGMVNAVLDNIPSLKTIEVCAFGGVNCAGGSNGGIFADGASDTFSLILTGDFTNGATIDPVGYKYQTNYGSYEFSCSTTDTTGQCGGGRTVPEPGSLALLGVIAAAYGTVRRRRFPR